MKIRFTYFVKRRLVTVFLPLGWLCGMMICPALAHSNAYSNANTDSNAALTLRETLALALENDPWLSNSRYQEQALLAQGEAANALPDPVLSAGMVNLPTDSLDFRQENMTQLKVGLTQQFPRGSSLRLRQARLQLQAGQQPLQRQLRQAQLTEQISQMWYQFSGDNTLLQHLQTDRNLFEQLIQIAETRYSNALQHTNQNAILRAELELARLDNQISAYQQQRDGTMATLAQWLGSRGDIWLSQMQQSQMHQSQIKSPQIQSSQIQAPQITPESISPPLLPIIDDLPGSFTAMMQRANFTTLAPLLAAHPELRHAQQKQRVSEVNIDLAQQHSQPQWGVSASYAYRADPADPRHDRADFVSLGVSVAVPLWNTEKNQYHLKAAKLQAQAVITEHRLLQQQLLADLLRVVKEDQHLQQQTQRYEQTILPKLQQYTQATIAAFSNQNANFEAVIRARIELRNAKLALTELHITRHKLRAKLHYLLTGSDIGVTSSAAALSSQ